MLSNKICYSPSPWGYLINTNYSIRVWSIEKKNSTCHIYKYLYSVTGSVGIKFDYIQSGKILVLITNAQGQIGVEKEIEATGSSYRQIAPLQRRIYSFKTIRRNEPSVLCQSTFH
jgi:hypothetical protein